MQQAGLWGKGFFGPFVPLQKGLAQEGETKVLAKVFINSIALGLMVSSCSITRKHLDILRLVESQHIVLIHPMPLHAR